MHQGRRGWRPGAEPSAIIAAVSALPPRQVPDRRPCRSPLALSRSPPAFPTSPCVCRSRRVRAPTRPRPVRTEQLPPRWVCAPTRPHPSADNRPWRTAPPCPRCLDAPCPESTPAVVADPRPHAPPDPSDLRTRVRHATHSMPVANYSPEPFAPGNDPSLSTWSSPSALGGRWVGVPRRLDDRRELDPALKRPRIPGPVRHRSADRVRVDVDREFQVRRAPLHGSEIWLLNADSAPGRYPRIRRKTNRGTTL